MSLDLAAKQGRAHGTASVSDLTAVDKSTFNSGDLNEAGSFLLQIDTSSGDIDASDLPTTLILADGSEAFTDGVRMSLVKVTTDANAVTFTDPVTGISYNYVNRQGESMSLVFDSSTGTPRWVAEI